MPRKIRSDSKLDTLLSDEQRDELRSWLVEDNLGYKPAVEKIAEEFDVSTSEGAVSAFYQRHCWRFKIKRTRETCETLGDVEGSDEFEAKALLSMRQLLFEKALSNEIDLKDLERLAGILGESKKLELKERELELNLAKFRETAKTAIEKGLDALHQEIKDTPAALELFERLKACVLQSVDGKAPS